MGKKKGGKWKTDNRPSAVGSDDEELYADMNQPDPNDDDYYHDAIDTFHAQRDKVLLEDEGDEDDADKEEVLSLGGDEDESDAQTSDEDDFDSEDDLEPIRDIYERNVQKDEMASDIDDEEDGLPDPMAWGKKKSTYYHTDFVDEDYEGIAESAAELAELEEKEAKALQRKLAEQLSDADFGLELFQVQKEEPTETTQKVAKDLSKLSSEEKLKLLSKESPELLELVEDFKSKMTELKDTILPLLELVKRGKITSEPAVQYLNLKRQLILQYCTNISFYLVLKAKRAPVANHPVIRRLVSFRKLLKELEPVDEKLSDEIHTVLEMISRGEDIIPRTKSALKATSKTKKLRVMQNIQDEAAVAEENVPKDAQKRKVESKVKRKFTEDEKEILDLYSASKKKARQDDEIDSDVNDEESDNSAVEGEEGAHKQEDEEDEEQGDERRGINYQIKKNKGLTIKRKKEYRNPRVHHKMKFRRAKINRKGQVREARKEVKKYGGEISGIRAGVSRSVKIK
ncbi:something about silencing protein 10-like [Ornithodoros turicata]|uniref:something about silencing protein 10-like n=1 Tax=Ornithodoros turicata TaxID=34597 RepID=UPI003139F948